MRDPPHKGLTAYGCWISPLTRFTGPHCGGLSSEAVASEHVLGCTGGGARRQKGRRLSVVRRPRIVSHSTARRSFWMSAKQRLKKRLEAARDYSRTLLADFKTPEEWTRQV